jgi:DNA-binding NarL/FixJ family response regulator
MKIKVAIVDDHHLVRKGLRLLLDNLNDFEILYEASNGEEFFALYNSNEIKPDIVLIDVNMPVMNGVQTTRLLEEKNDKIRKVALSVNTDLETVRSMIKAGACAYLFKDASPETFHQVLMKVYSDGFFYDKHVIQSLVPEIGEQSKFNTTYTSEEKNEDMELLRQLSARELTFLNYCCSELTYKEIADEMEITSRTVDGYRESLFYKLRIKSRIGLVIFAIKTGVYKI